MAERTPFQIVLASDDPASALAAFIAQELEAWGFNITASADPSQVVVYPPERGTETMLTIRVTGKNQDECVQDMAALAASSRLNQEQGPA